MQVLAAQLTVVFGRGAQALPQRPQFATDVVSAVSHPSAAVMLQSPNPALQVNVQALPSPQRAMPAFAGATQGSLRVARPSALQTVREVVPLGHVAIPGVQTQLEHIVPVHVDEPGHGRVIALDPSAAHTRTVRASTHDEVPGVHARSTHAPPEQRCMAPQGVGVVPKPSALQTPRTVDDVHVAVPGVHARMTQAPSRQPSPAAHATTIAESPSLAHTRRSVIDAHVAIPGVHERVTHMPSRQLSPSVQGIGA